MTAAHVRVTKFENDLILFAFIIFCCNKKRARNTTI
jgi:hypothetical protein